MTENIEKSRLEVLGEQVQRLSQRVETLWAENAILNQKRDKSDRWIVLLIAACQKIVRRADTLEERCSVLEQMIGLQSIRPSTAGTAPREEKSLNNDKFSSEMLYSQPLPHIPGLAGLIQGECERAREMWGGVGLVPRSQEVVSNNQNAHSKPYMPDYKGKVRGAVPAIVPPTSPQDRHVSQHHSYRYSPEGGQNDSGPSTGAGGKGPTAAIPTGQKRKAREMLEGSLNTTLSSSNSCGVELMFLNTFSQDCPTRYPGRGEARATKKPKARAESATRPGEPERKQWAHEEHPMPQVQGNLPTPEVQDSLLTPEVQKSLPMPQVQGSLPTPEKCGEHPVPQVHYAPQMPQAHHEPPMPQEQEEQSTEQLAVDLDILFGNPYEDFDTPQYTMFENGFWDL